MTAAKREAELKDLAADEEAKNDPNTPLSKRVTIYRTLKYDWAFAASQTLSLPRTET
jgi:hypothetical protein